MNVYKYIYIYMCSGYIKFPLLLWYKRPRHGMPCRPKLAILRRPAPKRRPVTAGTAGTAVAVSDVSDVQAMWGLGFIEG